MTAASASASASAFTVVRNAEEQYSVWFTGRPLPAGWSEVGVTGSRADCLAHIESVWTDLRPLTLRSALAAGKAA
ncbi:MbtH family protein [Streptomyces sp. NPDC054794]